MFMPMDWVKPEIQLVPSKILDLELISTFQIWITIQIRNCKTQMKIDLGLD